mmetsp:Transcript_45384/g.114240  ORF Transcript_45384/g.114240 Transcript_45384/m.114240 type:complete len:405 (-) Transcript_45384:1965-3179(-)
MGWGVIERQHLYAEPPRKKSNKMNSFPSASLYVGDLHPEVTEGQLFEVFNVIGPVASIRVCRDAITRRSLGYAYVNYHNVADAERALDTLNNTPIKGRVCRIMWSQRDPSVRKSGVGNVFIKNLDKSIDHRGLYDTFSAFGNILSCKVVMDDSNQSKGYGFVHFETQEQADKAINRVNEMVLNGKQVFVGPFIPKKERMRSGDSNKFTNVFVKNLDETMSESELNDMFSAFGVLKNCVIMKDENGKSKGFGFVNFENFEDAKKAVDDLNDKEVKGKKVFCARAQKTFLPFTSLSFRSSTAFLASSKFSKLTKPKPLDFPFSSFMITQFLRTPKAENMSLSSLSDMVSSRFFTNTFVNLLESPDLMRSFFGMKGPTKTCLPLRTISFTRLMALSACSCVSKWTKP